jgi:hypothetical protein
VSERLEFYLYRLFKTGPPWGLLSLTKGLRSDQTRRDRGKFTSTNPHFSNVPRTKRVRMGGFFDFTLGKKRLERTLFKSPLPKLTYLVFSFF